MMNIVDWLFLDSAKVKSTIDQLSNRRKHFRPPREVSNALQAIPLGKDSKGQEYWMFGGNYIIFIFIYIYIIYMYVCIYDI